MTQPSTRPGRLVVVGTGIRAVGQVTLEAAAWIERADIVCYGLSDAVTERWLRARARATEDLTAWYDPTLPRRASYAAMAGRLVAHVLAGRTTVAALYGHPGVFADPAHRAVAWLREHGHDAVMLPAVSAEDCLFADLGVDPGTIGCMSVEATDLIRRRRRPSTGSHLVV